MIQTVNAKINIGLNVVGRRADGYHELSTVFYPIGLFSGTPYSPWPFSDIIEITPIPEEKDHRFLFTGNPIDCPLHKNLVWKAVDAFEKRYYEKMGCEMPAMNIHLEKHIPDGAGLGGGSADASFTLLMLDRLTGGHLGQEELFHLSATLGADCPFFIYNRPCLAEGIGDRITPLSIDLTGYWLVILKPPFAISTKEAFSGIVCRSDNSEKVFSESVLEWRDVLVNDFETHLFEKYPVLLHLKKDLYDGGADYAQMSGSGSAVYGIFSSIDQAGKVWEKWRATEGYYSAIMRL